MIKLKKKLFHKENFIMSRAENRKLKKEWKEDLPAFIAAQKHFFPDLVERLHQVADPRQQGSIEYTIEEILYTIIMKNVCNITSMQKMTDEFNNENVVKNMSAILGTKEREDVPHYVTINECLEKLDPLELEGLRKTMVYTLLRKKSFNDAKFLKKYWMIIIDGTGLFYFKRKHCENCLKQVKNKGTKDEQTFYYHKVLEAKIVLGDNTVISIASEFIENESETVSKNDCEQNAFKRLEKKLKKEFPRLPICILGDSLYASEPVFDVCKKNDWAYLIRYKDGSIPSIAGEFNTIKEMNEAEEHVVFEEKEYKRRKRENVKHQIKWVSELPYKKHEVTVLELKIEKDGKASGSFQWLTNLMITGKTAYKFAQAGRKRWKIENEGFNVQKHQRYEIEHANSLHSQAMKNHYLLTQIADILMQMYEFKNKTIRKVKRIIKNISSQLLASFTRQLTKEDISNIQLNTQSAFNE